MLFDDTLRELLKQARTVAIVGAKDKTGSPVDDVARYLLSAGYRLLPVHPVRKTAWGLPVAPHLGLLAEVFGADTHPDIVCLFRAAEHCPDHARETLALPRLPLLFWMQEGICSPEAGSVLAGSGIRIVENLCLKTEHQRLLGSCPDQPGTGHTQEFQQICHTPSSEDMDKFFQCRRCGHCCQGEGGIVVSPSDLPRLSAHFHMPDAEFLASHTIMRDSKPLLISGPDGCCVFYRQGEGCSVHPARPDVCRAWPFFRGNLVDKDSFTMAKQDCPGINSETSHEAFARAGYAWLKKNGLLARDPKREGRALIVDEAELPGRAHNATDMVSHPACPDTGKAKA